MGYSGGPPNWSSPDRSPGRVLESSEKGSSPVHIGEYLFRLRRAEGKACRVVCRARTSQGSFPVSSKVIRDRAHRRRVSH